jgi:SAM-dependent methyltransferase
MSKRTFRRVTKTWDEFWAEFWRIRLVGDDDAAHLKNEQVVEFCWETLKMMPGMSVLDLGCGAGYQALLFAQRGCEVLGVDISPPLVKHGNKLAKKLGGSASFAVGDMRTFKSNKLYDRSVILGMSFGFGTEDENLASLKCVYDALAPGGKILITAQHPYSISNHLGSEWLECDEGILLHRGEFDPVTCRLGGSWELACPDGTLILEGENPELDGIRCYTVPELSSMLQICGFRKPNFFGAWYLPGSPINWFSMEMICAADKPKRS